MNCIGNKVDLGCFGNCDAIATGLVATQSGVHYVVYRFSGQINRSAFEGVVDEELIIPNIFNDYGASTFSIENPDGSLFVKTVDNEDYTNFQVRINPSNNQAPTVFAGVSDNPFTDLEKAKLEGLGAVTLFSDTEAFTGTYYGSDPVYVRRYSINISEFAGDQKGLGDFRWDSVKKLLRIEASIEYTETILFTLTYRVQITGLRLIKRHHQTYYELWKDLATPIQNTNEQFDVDIYYTKN